MTVPAIRRASAVVGIALLAVGLVSLSASVAVGATDTVGVVVIGLGCGAIYYGTAPRLAARLDPAAR